MSNSEDNESIFQQIARKRKEDPNFYENAKERFKTTYSTKVSDSPCLRSTALTSIPSSIVAGLATYLFTSRPRWSAHASFLTFFGVTVVYFKICYDDYKQKVKENKEVGEIMNLIVKYRGTEMEQTLRERYKEKVSQMDEKSKFV